MSRRVVVTGTGIVSPIGNTIDEFWNSLKNERVGIASITRFDNTDYKVKLAAQINDFEADKYLDNKEVKRMELFSQYAVAAAVQAVEE